ncbi:MAG: 2,3-bisphosphoglycerate-independent phosphoglycerate mutase [Pseudomonadota bacterium]
MTKPAMLMILDGWGHSETEAGNAVRLANTPHFDRLMATQPHNFLTTCGPAVGLPEGQMGNSEVGHLNIGAGRVVKQELPRIDDAVTSGALAEKIAASGLIDALAPGGTAHVMGLISDGGVHAHLRHAIVVAIILADAGVPVALHVFTDGRDTAPKSGRAFVASLESALPEGARIASVSGRYFAMDRDNRWERVAKAFSAVVGQGPTAPSADAAIAQAYESGETDEFITPTVIDGHPGLRDGDGVLFLNFRGDRAREILSALLLPDFDGFARDTTPAIAAAVGMVSYGGALDPVMKTLFAPQNLSDGLSETVSKAGATQIHMAETEKYPHVTYFLNGGLEAPFPAEERVMVPSPKVATYDLQPEMSALELTRRLLEAMNGGYDLIVVNFANPDMVGHTGSLEAAIAAVETVDGALGAVLSALDAAPRALIVTADHGNCETMIAEDGGPHTAHTLNVVPVVVQAPGVEAVREGSLADLAPTLLHLMGIAQPGAMTGRSLVD